MNKQMIKRIICATIGASVIAIGVPFFVKGNIGADCVTLLYNALANNVGLTIGRWTFIIGIFEVAVALILDKSKIGYTTLFYVLIGQFIIDFFMSIIPEQHTLIMGIAYIVIGIIICSTGCVICLAANVGLSVYDAFCFAITDKYKFKYVFVRYVVDGIHLIIGLLFKGLFGIGTIISFLCFGIVIDNIKKIIYKPIKRILE